jgi:hypothetical protein
MVRSLQRLASLCHRPLHAIRLDAKRRAIRVVSHPNATRLDDLAELALDVHLLIVGHGGTPDILIELAAQRRIHDPICLDGPEDITVADQGSLERARRAQSFISTIRAAHPGIFADEPSFADANPGAKLCTCAGEDHDLTCSFRAPESPPHHRSYCRADAGAPCTCA